MNIFKKIFNLLTLHEKKKIVKLFFLVLISGFVDVLGVASILPVITILANPEWIVTNNILSYLYNKSSLIGIESNEDFLFFILLLFFLILISSLFVRAFSNYCQIRFALLQEYSIGKRLLEAILSQNYSWFLDKNSSDFKKNILSEVSSVIYQAILPLITLISQGIIFMGMLTLIIIVDPQLAFAILLVFFLSFGGIFYLIKNYLQKIGTERLISNQQRFQELSNAFDFIKELKLRGLEKIFIDRFSKPSEIYAKNSSFALALAQVPRYFIEAIAFGGMIVLVLLLTYQKRDFIDILPFITLYAFAGYRIIPAAQQIYNSLTTIRFIEPATNNLDKNLNYLKKSEKKNISIAPSITLNQAINIKNINYCYPNSDKLALKNINIQIPAHSKIGIIGLTGSGKTTLIDLMLGLLDIKEGIIEVDGEKINKQNLRSWQKNIGYVPQQIFLSDTSIAENIAIGQDFENIDLETVKKVSKIADLDQFISSELYEGYKTIIGERGIRLSGGQRQRIGIARALYKKPNVLILDEATSALDNLTEKKVIQNILDFSNKVTIIIITHRLNSVKDCNNIILLKKGEVIDQGTYDDLERRNKLFFNTSIFKNKDKN